ncbi:MAG: alginate export family protein [Terracidiphilus sp.]
MRLGFKCSSISRVVWSAVLLLSCAVWSTGVFAQLPLPPPIHKPRAYELLRYNEDWSFLENPANRSDWLDPIKYMPFGRGGDSSYVSIGGEIRGVDERIQNDNWGGTPYPSNQFWLQRVQLHFDTHFNPQPRCFIQLESGLEEGRAGGPRPIDGKRLDFLNAFCDAGIGTSSHPITLRAGRQEFMFGSGRLVAPREGPNVRQSFYGISLTQSVSSWAVTAFAARPAVDKAGLFDDVPNSSTEFWGLFATRPWSKISRNVWDVYYYGLDRKNAVYEARTAHEVRQTVGTRIASHDPASMEGRIAIPHFDVEGIYQFGSFGTGNIRAWSVATEFGCILPKIPFEPRPGIRTDVSSGDNNLSSPNLQTFNPLFPIGNYFGVLSDTGPGAVNFRDLHPNLKLVFPHHVNAEADWLFWWRQSVADGVYGVPGNLLVPGGRSSARFVGDRPGLEVRWQVTRHAYLQGDYGIFYAGTFLRQSGDRKNLNFASAWVGYKF